MVLSIIIKKIKIYPPPDTPLIKKNICSISLNKYIKINYTLSCNALRRRANSVSASVLHWSEFVTSPGRTGLYARCNNIKKKTGLQRDVSLCENSSKNLRWCKLQFQKKLMYTILLSFAKKNSKQRGFSYPLKYPRKIFSMCLILVFMNKLVLMTCFFCPFGRNYRLGQ